MEIDINEKRRLAGKLRADPHQRVNAKRYPWAVLAEFAEAWEAANPAEVDEEPTKTTATKPNAPPSADLVEEAKGIAEHISAAQAKALSGLVNEGKAEGAGVATMGALVNKGLLTEGDESGEFDVTHVTPLGEAVAALLASA